MNVTYTQKLPPAQKKDAPTAASVLDASSQNEGLQRKADMANNAAQREEVPRPNNTGMPDNLKSGIESLSGFSMDDVRVHYNSSKPATVQALAYTQGTDIHLAPGQEKHLPHEAWHVAQQMAGRVSPTTNINGLPVNDNAGLEHEADVMGEKAVQCKANKSEITKNSICPSNVAQCENGKKLENIQKDTPYGYFLLKELCYNDLSSGAAMELLEFYPNEKIGDDGNYISLVQIVKESEEKIEGARDGNTGFAKRMVTEDGPYKGWAVDSDWIYKYYPYLDRAMLNRMFVPELGKDKLGEDHSEAIITKIMNPHGTDSPKLRGLNKKSSLLFINKDFRYPEIRLRTDQSLYHPSEKPKDRHNGWSTVKNEGKWDGSAALRDAPSGKKRMDFKVMALLNDDFNLGIIEWGYDSENRQVYFNYVENEDNALGFFAATARQWNSIELDKYGKFDSPDEKSHKLFQMPTEYKKPPIEPI
jgi:hypothetical protein